MGIETIVVGALVAVGKRLGGRALDDVADYLEGKAKEAVRRLASALDAPDREQATEAAAAELDRQVRADAQLAERLAKPPPPDRLRRSTRIEQLAEFLTYEFDLIAGVRRPVALPGFLNCIDCVARRGRSGARWLAGVGAPASWPRRRPSRPRPLLCAGGLGERRAAGVADPHGR